jgi:two-component system chemotaxis response regulator CheY
MARVLVVDDAAFMRKMVSDALVKGGHEVVGEAGNGLEAVAQYSELRPEVTTLDITMPEKDGITALREIIELDPGARVIMCSALGQGVQGARVHQARGEGLRRQAVPARPRDRGGRQGARLSVRRAYTTRSL